MTRQQVHRRVFLGELAATGALAALGSTFGCEREAVSQGSGASAGASARGGATVVVVQGRGVCTRGPKVEREAVQRMLEVGLRRLAGAADGRAALRRWLRPADVVGLKVNCMAGRQMATHVELVEELVRLMEQAGIRRRQAVVFDRSDLDLRRGGFPVRVSGSDYRSLGNDRGGYERELRVMKHGASRFSRIAAKEASALVNLPILKDHGLAGISGALKNNFGLVHNPNKFHLNGCDPHVAEVNAQAFVRSKQKLVICDALRVQVEGGPAYHAAGVQDLGRLLLATDPVALDVVAWQMLEELRRRRKLPSLKQDRREPVHIRTAARHGLGVGDRKQIKVIRIEVT